MTKRSDAKEEPEAWKLSRGIAVNRNVYRKSLAWQWVVKNRPDVAEAIQEECYLRYPRQRKTYKMELPKSLEKLK